MAAEGQQKIDLVQVDLEDADLMLTVRFALVNDVFDVRIDGRCVEELTPTLAGIGEIIKPQIDRLGRTIVGLLGVSIRADTGFVTTVPLHRECRDVDDAISPQNGGDS